MVGARRKDRLGGSPVLTNQSAEVAQTVRRQIHPERRSRKRSVTRAIGGARIRERRQTGHRRRASFSLARNNPTSLGLKPGFRFDKARFDPARLGHRVGLVVNFLAWTIGVTPSLRESAGR